LKIEYFFQTGDEIYFRDSYRHSNFIDGTFICSDATCSVEELVEIYFNQDISMREFAFKHNICKDKNVMGNMHIFRVAIEIYKFLSKEAKDPYFVLDKEHNKE
jgi:hypothetical protein